jgi:hypothetical protein
MDRLGASQLGLGEAVADAAGRAPVRHAAHGVLDIGPCAAQSNVKRVTFQCLGRLGLHANARASDGVRRLGCCHHTRRRNGGARVPARTACV